MIFKFQLLLNFKGNGKHIFVGLKKQQQKQA